MMRSRGRKTAQKESAADTASPKTMAKHQESLETLASLMESHGSQQTKFYENQGCKSGGVFLTQLDVGKRYYTEPLPGVVLRVVRTHDTEVVLSGQGAEPITVDLSAAQQAGADPASANPASADATDAMEKLADLTKRAEEADAAKAAYVELRDRIADAQAVQKEAVEAAAKELARVQEAARQQQTEQAAAAAAKLESELQKQKDEIDAGWEQQLEASRKLQLLEAKEQLSAEHRGHLSSVRADCDSRVSELETRLQLQKKEIEAEWELKLAAQRKESEAKLAQHLAPVSDTETKLQLQKEDLEAVWGQRLVTAQRIAKTQQTGRNMHFEFWSLEQQLQRMRTENLQQRIELEKMRALHTGLQPNTQSAVAAVEDPTLSAPSRGGQAPLAFLSVSHRKSVLYGGFV
jgi:hypothetical protein